MMKKMLGGGGGEREREREGERERERERTKLYNLKGIKPHGFLRIKEKGEKWKRQQGNGGVGEGDGEQGRGRGAVGRKKGDIL